MPSLSKVDVHTGERTSPLDVLNELGIEVGSKVCSDSIRGIYTVLEIRKESHKPANICLELSANIDQCGGTLGNGGSYGWESRQVARRNRDSY